MKTKAPTWLSSAIFYQVYPQSFADSNGDGIGDLPGLIAKLPYLKSLGISALWLNPIFESPFGDAGYDVSDFRKVAARYGTNADALRLFKLAHESGIKVVLDLVAGHTSAAHPWFIDSARQVPGEFRDRYVWTDAPWSALAEKGFIIGNSDRAAAYQANFFYFQPSLNYGYARPDPAKPWQQSVSAPGPQATRAELRDIMEFWLKAGCDGFRVDMADSLVKGDPDRSGIREFWQNFRTWFDAEWPEAVLVSEWGNPEESIRAGFHIDFMLHFGEPAYRHLMAPCVEPAASGERFATPCYFQKQGGVSILPFLENYCHHLKVTRGAGYIALPTGNHDFSRPSYGRDARELRVIYAMLLTLPGVPFIYYGDEIGLRYHHDLPSREGGYGRTGTRTPMQWLDGAHNFGFSTAPETELYLPVDPRPDAPTVSSQDNDKHSLLHLTRSLIALRRSHSALGNDATFRSIFSQEDGKLFIYERADEFARYAIAINPGESCCRVEISELECARIILAEGASLDHGKLSLDGVSFAILKFN